MTQPKYAASEETGRYYSFPGQQPLISVTSVIGVIHKPSLVPWAAKLAGERAVAQENGWHTVQQEALGDLVGKWLSKKKNAGLTEVPESERWALTAKANEAARKWISRAPKEYMEYRQMLGSAVHYACETDFDLNDSKMRWFVEQVGSETPIRKMHNQYKQFLSDNDVKVVAQEMTVASLTHGYAGTLDLIIEMHGRRYLADIKTGKSVFPSTSLQLAAYRYAEYQVGDDGSLADYRPEVEGAVVIHLKPQSYKVVEFRCDEPVFDVFLKAKALKEWDDSSKEMFV